MVILIMPMKLASSSRTHVPSVRCWGIDPQTVLHTVLTSPTSHHIVHCKDLRQVYEIFEHGYLNSSQISGFAALSTSILDNFKNFDLVYVLERPQLHHILSYKKC